MSVAVGVALIAASTVAALPAQALGQHSENCAYHFTATGKSSQSNGGQTAVPGSSTNPDYGCRDAKVRVFYRPYPGGPLLYTGWHSAYGIVTYDPGNYIGGANHDVGSPAPAYAGKFPFTT